MTSTVEYAYDSPTWTIPAERTSTLRVALAGCGAVGSALLREFAQQRDALADRHGVAIEVVRVLVRDLERERNAPFDARVLTNDLDEFLATSADVVVEAIGGLDPARHLAATVLGRGQRLVTANKELLAAHGSELSALAHRCGTTLRYDAAVGGGVPILRVLDESLGAGGATRVRGILNGTSNFVLTRLEQGASLDEALEDARQCGFAEADVSRDLDGRDAADKLALIAWTAFGIPPESLVVRRTTLLPDPRRYVDLAARLGARVRQVAECELLYGSVIASVEPVLVAADSALGRTHDEGNLAEVFTGWRAPLCASGPGAGGLPTATALLSDLVSTSTARRRRLRAHAAQADARAFRWTLEIHGGPSLLHRHVPGCALVHTNESASCSWTTIAAATAVDVAAILHALERAGATPIAARWDEGCR